MTRLSFSRLQMFERCGEQYRRRYVEDEVVPPGIAMYQGTSVHAAAQANYRQKLLTGVDLSPKDIRDIAMEEWRAGTRAGLMLTAEEELVGEEKVLGQAEKRVSGAAVAFATEVAPLVRPAVVEQTFVLPVGDDAELVFRPDVIETDDGIRDLKISGRRLDPATALQLTLYCDGYWQKTGRFPPRVGFDVIAPKTGKVSILTATRRAEDFTSLHARLNAMYAALQAGLFMPAPPDSWYCSARFCGYFRTCRYAVQTKEEGWG